MKAWRVDLNECDSLYVLAESEHQALAKATVEANDRDIDWEQTRLADFIVTRLEVLDGAELTNAQLVHQGFIFSWCAECDAKVDSGNLVTEDGDDRFCYCSDECRDQGAERGLTIYPNGMPSHPPQLSVFVSTEY